MIRKAQFKPQQTSAQQAYQYWMHYAEGSLMPLLVMQLVIDQSATASAMVSSTSGTTKLVQVLKQDLFSLV